MRNNSSSRVVRGAYVLSTLMCALAAVPANAESTSDALTRIEAETLVLKAKERQLEVQSSILTKQNEIATKQSMGSPLTETSAGGDPVVRAIEGIGSGLYATLQMSNGSIVDVQPGSELPGGMKIVSIKTGSVFARTREGRTIRLSQYSNTMASPESLLRAGGAGGASSIQMFGR